MRNRLIPAIVASPLATAMALLTVASIGVLPCHAQYTSGHAMPGAAEEYKRDAVEEYKRAVALQGAMMGTISPHLSTYAMGNIGRQDRDATPVAGVNTAGRVRVNNLAMLEALLNIVANSVEITVCLWGGFLMVTAIFFLRKDKQKLETSLWASSCVFGIFSTGLEAVAGMSGSLAYLFVPRTIGERKARARFWWACAMIKAGILFPMMVNWLVAAARDANLFS